MVDQNVANRTQGVVYTDWERVFWDQAIGDVNYAAGDRCANMVADVR